MSIARDQMIAEQTKRAEMVRQRDALNWRVTHPRDIAVGRAVEPEARAESRRLTAEIGKIPNAGRAFRRASRERASRIKPSYPLPVVRDVGPTNGMREMSRRRRQIAAGVIRVTG